MKFKLNFKNIFYGLGIIISSLLLSFSLYLNTYFHLLYFEQLLYNFLNMENLNITTVSRSIQSVLLGTFIFLAIFILPLLIAFIFKNLKLEIKIRGKKIKLFPLSLKWYSIILVIVSILVFLRQIGFFQYAANQFSSSNFYEDYYVAYDDELVTFPSDKQNLIYIFVESFETGVFSDLNGGLMTESYSPNIEKLALDEINFSNTDKLGGFKNINGANWTAAGMVAQTSGTPIYIQTKNKKGKYLEGVTSLGDILESNGYRNYLMMGSNANFAERRNYFAEHGNYQILDYQHARMNRLIPYDYFVWWGYEDRKLYQFAKDKLLDISNNNEPFNFTLLTADTHYFNGYTDKLCPNNFSHPYANSYYCMDLQLSEFVNWIKEQDFYDNTTIVIVGDHLAMQTNLFHNDKEYVRTIFNLFINSKVDALHTNNREFSAFDMFPSTIAALGGEIEGNRLALGTNLFSDRKTLAEELSYEGLQIGLRKNSKYYKENLLKK